jgi:ParB family chromosome partitioning protein
VIVVAGSRALEQLGQSLTVRQTERQPGPNAVVALPLESIVEPPRERRLRDVEDDADLETLVESLRAHGLLHPIGVRPAVDGNFEVIYGSRRVAAARWLGWRVIQASLHLDLDDEPALVAGLAENLHRKDLAPRERAAALRLLARIHTPGRSIGGFSTGGHAAIQPPPRQPGSSGDLARKLGVDVSTISRLSALGHDEQLLGMVETGELGLTQASHVARLPEPMRRQMLEDIEAEHLSANATHIRVNRLLRQRNGANSSAEPADMPRNAPSAPLRRLQIALGVLASIEELATDQERKVLEQIGEHVRRLQAS